MPGVRCSSGCTEDVWQEGERHYFALAFIRIVPGKEAKPDRWEKVTALETTLEPREYRQRRRLARESAPRLAKVGYDRAPADGRTDLGRARVFLQEGERRT